MPGGRFRKGDKVEVTRDDDQSLWFPATVIRPSPSLHQGQMYVEFETLSPGENETRRLREYVSAANVRPFLPVGLNQYFKVGEKADAFHENGWRVGTVAEILESSRYLVSFDGEGEGVEFNQWSLRTHRDWNDGSWVPPLPEKRKSSESEMKHRVVKLRMKRSGRTTEANFSKGTMVEVSSNEEGYQDSWYTAIILDMIETDKFLVEYQTLRTDDERELLKEKVDASYIRPLPPIPLMDHFKQFQQVDAWYNEGWWVGHIFKCLDDRKFTVHFMSTNEAMTVEHSKLRPHQDWIDQKWVAGSMKLYEMELNSAEREVKFKMKDGARTSEAKFRKGTTVEVKSIEEGYQGSWYSAVIVEPIGTDKFLVEYQTLKTEDEKELLKENADASSIRPSPPIIQRVDRFKLLDKVDAWYNDGWWVGLIFRVLDKLTYVVYFWNTNEEFEFGHFSLRPHQEWIGGKWVADFKKKSSVLPLKPRPGKLMRQKGGIELEGNYLALGVKIEVKSDGDGSEGGGHSGCLYPAVIVGYKGTGKYLVEYRTLKMENGIQLLKEEVDATCTRPCPPIIQRTDHFEPCEEVDAWYNGAWWVGAVCNFLQGSDSSEYVVYIRGTNEVLDFQHFDLRPHQDWTEGKWIVASRGSEVMKIK